MIFYHKKTIEFFCLSNTSIISSNGGNFKIDYAIVTKLI